MESIGLRVQGPKGSNFACLAQLSMSYYFSTKTGTYPGHETYSVYF
jgi:hypothetical protein